MTNAHPSPPPVVRLRLDAGRAWLRCEAPGLELELGTSVESLAVLALQGEGASRRGASIAVLDYLADHCGTDTHRERDALVVGITHRLFPEFMAAAKAAATGRVTGKGLTFYRGRVYPGSSYGMGTGCSWRPASEGVP